jgi:putative ABC transport system permease protein
MAYASRLGDILRISIRRVFRHRRRYLGPALAISLGAAGLIVVLSMSGHVKAEFNEKLDLLGGATILQVYFEEKPLDVPWTAKQRFFYWELVNALRKVPGVRTVSMAAFKSTPAQVLSGDRRKDFTLIAVDNSFWKLHSFTPMAGTFFDKKAIDDGERVCVIGAEVARLLFDSEEVAGRNLIIENELYEVSGVLDGFRVGEGTRFLFVPLTTALTRIGNMTLPVRLFVRCRSWEDVDAVAAAIPKVVGDYLYTDRLRVDVVWDNLKRVKRVAYWLELFADVCVIATLILGGVGIWNIMMAGVRARTREIGVKKAVGAEDRDILIQFMTESLSVCLGAVLAGILLGGAAMELIGFLLNRYAPLALFLRAMGWSVFFAVALGLGAGLYPAYKAGRMEVASALRYE